MAHNPKLFAVQERLSNLTTFKNTECALLVQQATSCNHYLVGEQAMLYEFVTAFSRRVLVPFPVATHTIDSSCICECVTKTHGNASNGSVRTHRCTLVQRWLWLLVGVTTVLAGPLLLTSSATLIMHPHSPTNITCGKYPSITARPPSFLP